MFILFRGHFPSGFRMVLQEKSNREKEAGKENEFGRVIARLL
jgi:hypothetical protein